MFLFITISVCMAIFNFIMYYKRKRNGFLFWAGYWTGWIIICAVLSVAGFEV